MKITIDGIIGFDSDDRSVRDQLNAAKGKDIVAEIASPGGMISEGLKIYNTLKNYEGRVDTHLVGSVASMATYIAMAGEKRTAERNAVFMIHNGSTIAIGDHNTMFKVGKHLESLTNIIAKEYAIKTGTLIQDIRKAMDDETFYYGDEIQEAGFVHEMVGDVEPEDRAEAVAMAELMIQECQEKVNQPEFIKKDINALAMIMQAPMGENNNQKKGKHMEFTLENLKKEAPDLLTQIQADAKKIGYDEGLEAGAKQERERVSALLSVEDADPKAKEKAISEGLTVDASYKLFYEAEKQSKKEKLEELEKETPESVGQSGKEKETDETANFMAEVDRYQKENKCSRTKAMKAVVNKMPELHKAFIDEGRKEK